MHEAACALLLFPGGPFGRAENAVAKYLSGGDWESESDSLSGVASLRGEGKKQQRRLFALFVSQPFI